mgnify:CR=1 FL=1
MLIAPPRKVIVQPLYDRDISPGGIIIPDSSKERCDQGIVKYMGKGCKYVFIGAHVIFNGYAGTTLQLEGEGTIIILEEYEIGAIVEQQPIEMSDLYFKDVDRTYQRVTYEEAMHLIASNLNLLSRVDKSYEYKGDKRNYATTSLRDLSEYEEHICKHCGSLTYDTED